VCFIIKTKYAYLKKFLISELSDEAFRFSSFIVPTKSVKFYFCGSFGALPSSGSCMGWSSSRIPVIILLIPLFGEACWLLVGVLLNERLSSIRDEEMPFPAATLA